MKRAQLFGVVVFLIIVAVIGTYYYVSRPIASGYIRISTNPWVGFTPFIYAQEKGWIEKTPFRFVWLVDLSDNARLYQRGFTQGFTATQYELLHFNNKAIKPVFIIDRSSGADAIVSNRTVNELRDKGEPVTVYLERGSLNEDFFKAFVQEKALQHVAFHQLDMSQKNIVGMKYQSSPVLIISYQPYLSRLIANGYRTIASTRDMKTFSVIDALFVDENVLKGREEEFIRLKKIYNRAVECLQENPQEYYGTIYGYLEGQSYEEFMDSTKEVEWLYRAVPEEVLLHLQQQNIQTDKVLP